MKANELWMVMNAAEPLKIHDALVNINKDNPYKAPIEFFVPFVTFQDFNIHDEEVQRNYAALRRFVFIRKSRKAIDRLRLQNRWELLNFGYYRNHAGDPLTIRDAEMRAFMALCSDSRINYEIWPTIDGLEINETVILQTTPFKGWEARVLDCRHIRHGNRFTVGIDMMGGTMLLHIKNLQEEDIRRKYAPDRQKQEYRLVEWIKATVKSALDATIKSQAQPASRHAEPAEASPASPLDKVWSYRHNVITGTTSRRHFKAMLLICALLRKDTQGIRQMQEKVEQELEDIAQLPESKRFTDAWASLQVAMYLATKNPEWRDAVKAYERRYHPKSTFLHSMIQIIRRFEV